MDPILDPMQNKGAIESRRDFLKTAAVLPLAVNLGGFARNEANAQAAPGDSGKTAPWYRTTYRWGQINLNELDPQHFDMDWWRSYWRRAQTQGLVINAGGIIAFYPTKEPLQHQAQYLNGGDLYGDLTRAAHADGLKVFARMDCGSAFGPFYKAHPDWFAVNADGQPYRTGLAEAGGRSRRGGGDTSGEERDDIVLYTTCINGPYYEEYIPRILREIAAHEKPEGFTDNHWAGQGRDSMCYCVNCKSKFKQYSGKDLPTKKDWDDPVYRQWIEWSHKRRLEIWDLFNRTTREAGGPECIWSGMLSGNFVQGSASFRDMKELCERADIIMLDHQARGAGSGFQENGDTGKRVHGLGGWDKLAPESMATYGPRKAARPAAEVQMWMVEAAAGTIQPWWHHVGAYQEDRRQFHVVEPFFRWYSAHQEYMIHREPVATVGVVYSQRNFEWYGRDDANRLALAPYNGVTEALLRARIPYLPVHADHIDREAGKFSVLVLPNLAAMTNSQVEAVRRFVGKGGSLIATDETSLYDEYGDVKSDFALADVFGANYTGRRHGNANTTILQHTYLRLTPDVGQDVDGPRHGDEPAKSAPRHPALRGFEETNILTFGGELPEVKPAPGTTVLLTLIPEFPVMPPENSWMRHPRSGVPGLLVREQNGARIAFLPADIDRRYEQGNTPDHGDLLANLVRWAAKDDVSLEVKGPGLIDCHLYRQQNRLILHLVNLTSAGTWRIPAEELIPVGPLTVRVKLPEGVAGNKLMLAASGENSAHVRRENGWAQFEVKSILDHEVAILA